MTYYNFGLNYNIRNVYVAIVNVLFPLFYDKNKTKSYVKNQAEKHKK